MRLAVDATVGVTDLVEKMHHTIQLGHAPIGPSQADKTSGLTGLVYRSIRGTTRLLGQGFDAGLAPLVAMLPDETSNTGRDALISAINGVYGDRLVETDNPLATEMSFRYRGRELDREQLDLVPGAKGKVLLFVHGLCLNEGHWTRNGKNLGEALADELGYTPVYLRYNTGLPIATNGLELSTMLETLIQNWPHGIEELAIVGHSMGGLLARSACHHACEADHAWLQHLKKLVSIGTPHHGAPLERGGNWINYAMDMSPYAAPFTSLSKQRSVGITDLRHGSIALDAQEFVPLPTGVECYAMAGTLAKKPSRLHQHLLGDGLVSVDSALGINKDPVRTLDFPENRQWLGYETGHIELLGRGEVYAQLRDWFQ
jgi:pimeloyl-ACP methyl ester carboxylesterase